MLFCGRPGSGAAALFLVIPISGEGEPFDGLGKPEPLKGNLSGYWSRRVDDSNRLVYFANDDELAIIACRLHYGDK
ncbi:addiction module toxin, Txe/YoeB family [compost metagenome]